MFNKSRRKIILSIMGSLLLLFVMTLSVILLASYRELRQNNEQMLSRYIEMYSLGQQEPGQPPEGFEEPGQRPGGMEGPGQRPEGLRPDELPIDERRDFQLSTFYSVALDSDGTVLAVDIIVMRLPAYRWAVCGAISQISPHLLHLYW